MLGHLKDLTLNRDGTQNITVTVRGDFRPAFDGLAGAPVDIDIKRHKERRSLSANAYFHVLVNRIAEKLHATDDEVKTRLVIDYGVIARDADGQAVGFMLPASVDVDRIYKYVRLFDERVENGKLFRCYLVYKPTHEMDTAEMCRLIDGAVSEAKELGIETATPAELARLREEWERGKA